MRWLLLIVIAIVVISGCIETTTTTTTTSTIPILGTTPPLRGETIAVEKQVELVSALSGNMRIRNIGSHAIDVTDLDIYVNDVLQNCGWDVSSIEPNAIAIANCTCTSDQEVKVVTSDIVAIDTCEVSEIMACIAADMSIENVYINFSTNISRVLVKNSGFSNNEITSAQLLNASDNECTIITTLPIDFPKNSSKNIEFNITDKIFSCTDFEIAKVTTECFTRSFTGTPTCS